MKYIFMLGVAFCLAIISSIMTALGMTELFATAGIFILILFIIIDLGRFLLFNFVVDEWNNLRKVKYLITLILALLFVYSAVGIFAKLDSLISIETKNAMINAASYNKAALNAEIKQSRSEDLAKIAQNEYQNSIDWNKTDYENCLKRAKQSKNISIAENKCNNTKRRLDKAALTKLEESLKTADTTLSITEKTTKLNSKNQSEIASVLTTICKITQKDCTTYDSLQNSITILIFLVIIGTDYLQIAIILAVNTRKNKLKLENKPKLNTDKINIKIEPKKVDILQELNTDLKTDFLASEPLIIEEPVTSTEIEKLVPEVKKRSNSAVSKVYQKKSL